MKRYCGTKCLLLLFVIAVCVQALGSPLCQAAWPSDAYGDKKVVLYFDRYTDNYEDIRYDEITHIVCDLLTLYSNGDVNEDVIDPEELRATVELAHAHGVKVFMCYVGGGAFIDMMASPTARANFIQNLVDVCIKYNLDGADNDVETWLTSSQMTDMANLTVEIKQAFAPRGLEQSVCLAGWFADSCMDSFAWPSVDFWNVMSYFVEIGDAETNLTTDWDLLTRILPVGFPKEDIVVATPLWGETDTGVMSYKDMLGSIITNETDNYFGDWSVCNIDTQRDKGEYYIGEGYAGLMAFSYRHDTPDEEKALLNVLSGAVRQKVYSMANGDYDYTPGHADNPSPANSATDVSTEATLSWREDSLAEYHRVYLDTDNPPTTIVSNEQRSQGYTPGTALDADTTYYWKVVQGNEIGWNTTSVPVWSFTTAEATLITDKLLGYWPYDGDVVDGSGLLNYGTPGGDPTYVTGKVGSNAIYLDGDDYVTMDPVANDFTDPNNITLNIWVKTTDSAGECIACNTSSAGNVFLFDIAGGKAALYDGGSYEAIGTTTVNDGYWHMLTYVRSNSTGYIYVDGDLEDTHTANFTFASSDHLWSVGQEWDLNDTPSDFLTGTVDEPAIWGRALDTDEIAYLYNSGSGNAMTIVPPDTTAPATPTWVVEPVFIGTDTIYMRASDVSDPSGVEYQFDCTEDNELDSGWRSSPQYEVTDVTGDSYEFRVQARDLSPAQNTGSWSTYADTDDEDAPTPNPATFSSAPSAVYSGAISMTATTGSDKTGPVYYYFDETSGENGGTDSGWQTSPDYTDSGLDPNTQYTYTVQMRDSVSPTPNVGTASSGANATTDDTPDLAPGLVGYWPLDEDTGSSAADESTNSNDGSISGAAWATGKFGTALNFDGSNDYVGCGTDSSLRPTSALSISAWVKVDTYNAWASIAANVHDTGYTESGWSLSTASGGEFNAALTGSDGTITWGATAGTYSTGQWLHLVQCFDGSTVTLYVNGSQASSYSESAPVDYNPIPNAFELGRFHDDDEDYWFDGVIDDVGVWNRELNSVEVAYLYNSGDGNPILDAGPDTDAPTPNPATFASAPAAVSDTEITMTATTGSDATGPVEYYFDETTSGPGATDSGWTTDPVYNDTGLTASTQYTYTVQMRDSVGTPNVGTASSPANATTDAAPDTTAPSPDAMTWATVPYATGSTSISMTASTATDPSGVEYYFTCTAGGGNDSNWQDSTIYEDTGLSPSTQYTYTVKARDKSAAQNETAASTAESATTDAGSAPGQATNPNPSDEQERVDKAVVLSWTAGSGATSHDVYFGTSNPPSFVGNQSGTTYDPPGNLAKRIWYYWRIDEVNDSGTTTGVVWSFKTK